MTMYQLGVSRTGYLGIAEVTINIYSNKLKVPTLGIQTGDFPFTYPHYFNTHPYEHSGT